MANKIIKKANSRLKYLFRKSSYLNVKCKKMLTSALVSCHYDYACCVWYNSLTQNTKNRLKIGQNKMVRLILNMQPRDSLKVEHFKKANIMPFQYRVNCLKLNHMYKIYNNISPSYLFENFGQQEHNHNTRGSFKSYQIPQCKSQGKNGFKYTAIVLWNNLNQEIKNAKSYTNFKNSVKKLQWSTIDKVNNDVFLYV